MLAIPPLSLSIIMQYRRKFLQTIAASSGAALAMRQLSFARMLPFSEKKRRFTIDFCPGRVGVKSDSLKTIELAKKFGFESVEPFAEVISKMDAGKLEQLQAARTEARLVWGAAGLPIDFRKTEELFSEGIKTLPAISSACAKAGVTRMGTWIMPCHDSLTYMQNMRQHATRLRVAAKILKDNNLRLGLEYVGPKTLWTSKKYAFVHTLAETMELLAEIGQTNVGIVLDSWHWYTAQETREDISKLKNEQVVAVDLNDAPSGVAVESQIDSKRMLPSATGVIDVKAFLDVLVEMDYDGPVRAEPFNQELNDLEDEPATEKTSAAMKKAIGLVGLAR
jgi:sugar phosphate isomerase/epimerase